MLGQCLILEDLLIGRDNGVELGDGYAGNILAVDDADGLSCVLAQDGELRTVHDALSIEVAQTVCHNTQIVVGKPGNPLVVIFIELADLLAHDLLIINVVGFIALHQTVAFSLHSLFTFIDGKVKRRTQVVINPGLTPFYFKTGLCISGHQPDDDSGSGHNQC